MGRMTMIRASLTGALTLGFLVFASSPAAAEARVSVSNSDGAASIDPEYLTTLSLNGSGFQAISGGFGGIYVQFGAKSGSGYLKLPDERDSDNAGYVRFIAFPGGETADEASTEMSNDGDWSTTLNVPGATFTAENGSKVDCRTMTCGVITIGAHGVVNKNNETFTEVEVADLTSAEDDESSTGSNTRSGTAAQTSTTAPDVKRSSVPAALTVDRAAARPGRILAFNAVGLTPGSAVNASFADGLAAAGPLTVNSAGEVAGLIQLPSDVEPGTYQLRLIGHGDLPSARFAIIAPTNEVMGVLQWAPYAFAAAGLIALVGALAFGTLRWRRWKHAT